jgi:hypothetical protein
MHKAPQPVKLWYLSSFFRYERAQAGRYRQFWQVGAEAIGSDDPAVDAETITLLHALLTELGVRDVALRLGSLGRPATRATYRELLVGHLRAHEDLLSDDVRERIDLNPLRAFDADHAGTRQVMASAPLLVDHLAPEDAEHFAEVRARLDVAGIDHEVDPTLVRGLDYYTRTVFEFTSGVLGAQSAVGGGGRYDGLIEQLGGPPTPGIGWAAGVERILLGAEPRPQPARPLRPLCRGDDHGGVRARHGGTPRRARRPARARRPLGEGAPEGRGPRRRAVDRARARRHGRDRAQGHGVRRAGARGERLRRGGAGDQRKAHRMKQSPQANRYRDAWTGELTKERAGTSARVSGWVHRRRDHGGLIFIDLRDRSGIVQLVFHPDTSGEAFGRAERLRSEHVVSAAGHVVEREAGNVNPNLATGEIELGVTELEVLAESDTPPFPLDEGGHVDETLRLTHRALDLRRDVMRDALVLRHDVIATMRRELDGRDFLEVETPILTRSTPEGARDFLVPAACSPARGTRCPSPRSSSSSS